ncbi:DNA polymerase III subunit epsilon [Pleionea sp. CnH1-48]|uniref:DNA polymerase III subunit epsilon n=1 Tax=Pleionea sp. CnH1-48 TaxID=2954494 RepID=UPI0020981434|nr:DNA polymerase III subunit epsilon [Pleionea sp. CnH1-48]MCO7225422.1 DNA polymerase III subunit epsilon [Pleionea sp. CnH1-48]
MTQEVRRQVVLDTETTGLEPEQGHKIIEIGCVELVNRRLTGRHYHQYLQPDREIDDGAIEVHGITNEFLADKPRFADVVDDFLSFVDGAELVIHNAPFDIGFLDWELKSLGAGKGVMSDYCSVLDTLVLARQIHPGQKNNLDALCKRYAIDNSHRDLHGALLDSEILADVYLMMTGGQTSLTLSSHQDYLNEGKEELGVRRLTRSVPLKVVGATDQELSDHTAMLETIRKAAGGESLWDKLN